MSDHNDAAPLRSRFIFRELIQLTVLLTANNALRENIVIVVEFVLLGVETKTTRARLLNNTFVWLRLTLIHYNTILIDERTRRVVCIYTGSQLPRSH